MIRQISYERKQTDCFNSHKTFIAMKVLIFCFLSFFSLQLQAKQDDSHLLDLGLTTSNSGTVKLLEEKKDNEIILIVQQQGELTVKGVVSDEEGNPLPGVTITVEGSPRGVITDIDGNYSIEVKPNDRLTFSFIGLQSQTVDVNNRRSISVVLTEQVSELDEVTIVAFGKQKKESVISSISTVSTKDLRVPSSNLTTAFSGRIAGMISYQTSREIQGFQRCHLPGDRNTGTLDTGYKCGCLCIRQHFGTSPSTMRGLMEHQFVQFSFNI